MKNTVLNRLLFVATAGMLLLSSCSTPTDIAYISQVPREVSTDITGEFSKGIQANDLLYIYVESETPDVTVLFNQETNKIAKVDNVVINPGSSAVTGYLVNRDGDIIFPVLGKLHVLGLTHAQLAALIERRLVDEGHILDAVVTVKLMNFTVSVLGEVKQPGLIQVNGERLTIFEALSRVGDITLYGRRDNVTVIREENGVRTIGELDLTSQNVFNSPYYYLHQNDMVYVEPNTRRKHDAERDPLVQSYISMGLSILSTLSSMFYYYILSQRYLTNN